MLDSAPLLLLDGAAVPRLLPVLLLVKLRVAHHELVQPAARRPLIQRQVDDPLISRLACASLHSVVIDPNDPLLTWSSLDNAVVGKLGVRGEGVVAGRYLFLSLHLAALHIRLPAGDDLGDWDNFWGAP